MLVNYSCDIKKGDKVLIEQSGTDIDFLIILIKEIRKAGGMPFINNIIPQISRELLLGVDENYVNLKTQLMLPNMKKFDAYISIDGSENIFETSDVPAKNILLNNKLFQQPVHFNERVNHTKWVILRWPTSAFAQSAGMSTIAFKKLFFKVCTINYAKMDTAMNSLQELLNKTNKVQIIAKNTNIVFSIKDIPSVKCSGKNNIPDGEVFTAPIKNSVNGQITYNVPTLYNGNRFNNVCFVVKNGKIVKASCDGNNALLNKILNTDEGARYFGEFALGVNPYVKKPILDILFDEKMRGSIHLTAGNCYQSANNGNKSGIHWDLVLCQEKQYGGGEIYFDDKLIRKDGKFVISELFDLNPENLV